MSRKAALKQARGGGKVCSFSDVLLRIESGCLMEYLFDKTAAFCFYEGILKEFFKRSETYEDCCLR